MQRYLAFAMRLSLVLSVLLLIFATHIALASAADESLDGADEDATVALELRLREFLQSNPMLNPRYVTLRRSLSRLIPQHRIDWNAAWQPTELEPANTEELESSPVEKEFQSFWELADDQLKRDKSAKPRASAFVHDVLHRIATLAPELTLRMNCAGLLGLRFLPNGFNDGPPVPETCRPKREQVLEAYECAWGLLETPHAGHTHSEICICVAFHAPSHYVLVRAFASVESDPEAIEKEIRDALKQVERGFEVLDKAMPADLRGTVGANPLLVGWLHEVSDESISDFAELVVKHRVMKDFADNLAKALDADDKQAVLELYHPDDREKLVSEIEKVDSIREESFPGAKRVSVDAYLLFGVILTDSTSGKTLKLEMDDDWKIERVGEQAYLRPIWP